MTSILDLKDKKILYELDKNSRISYIQLAKKTGIKQETARYRVQNLIKRGIITKFQTIIDASKIGISYYKIFFRLQKSDNQTREEIISYLTNNPRITWVGKIDGPYDLGINLIVENLQSLNEFLSELFDKYPENIIEKKISVNLEGRYFNRDYLVNNKRDTENNKIYSSVKFKKVHIDQTDFNILKIMSQNSRTSTVEIGNKLDISHDSALKRLKKLEKNKIITGYSIVINNEIIGQLNYKILLYLRNFSEKNISKICSYLQSFNEVTYIVKALSNWDIDFEVEVTNVQKLRNIMMDLTNQFSDIISRYELLLIYEFSKYDYLPAQYTFEEYSQKLR